MTSPAADPITKLTMTASRVSRMAVSTCPSANSPPRLARTDAGSESNLVLTSPAPDVPCQIRASSTRMPASHAADRAVPEGAAEPRPRRSMERARGGAPPRLREPRGRADSVVLLTVDRLLAEVHPVGVLHRSVPHRF